MRNTKSWTFHQDPLRGPSDGQSNNTDDEAVLSAIPTHRSIPHTLLLLQVHIGRVPTSYMGSSSTITREHPLRCKFEQHSIRAQEHFPECSRMDSIRPLPLWSTIRSRGADIHIRTARNGSSLRQSIRLHECSGRADTNTHSVLSAVVREHVWTCTCKLCHAGLSSRPESY